MHNIVSKLVNPECMNYISVLPVSLLYGTSCVKSYWTRFNWLYRIRLCLLQTDLIFTLISQDLSKPTFPGTEQSCHM